MLQRPRQRFAGVASPEIAGNFARDYRTFRAQSAAVLSNAHCAQQQLQTFPQQFALYDDIAVAQEKLGRDDDALQTIARKRQLLPTFNAKDQANKEAWYRYFANAGTFRAHRWLKTGADKAEIGEMTEARAMIKRAIEIKPDAHFGRERYQLMAMDWILARRAGKTDKTLGQWIGARDGWKSVYPEAGLKDSARKRAVEGLAGLIVLGGAWQSPDVFEALAAALETPDGVTLRHLTLLRAQELVDAGKPTFIEFKPSLSDDPMYPDYDRSSGSALIGGGVLAEFGVGVNAKNKERLNALFPQLRSGAEAWNVARQNWMIGKMQNGAHPDTNADFWDGYRESAAPSLDMEWSNSHQQRIENILRRDNIKIYSLCAFIIGAGIFLAFLILRRSRAPRKLA